MARDYKTKRGKRAGFSGWMGVVCGLAAGLGVAGIVYIKDHRPDAPLARTGKAEKRKSHGNDLAGSDGGDTGTEGAGKSYDFYDMLPKFEMVVPEKDKD